MAGKRKAELKGMQDPFYPKDDDHASVLRVVDPELAFYLSATQPASRDTAPVAEVADWSPSDPEAFFRGLGYGAIQEPGSGDSLAQAAA